MMNWLFYINFAIFSVFLTLFLTELMGSVLLLVAYDATKRKVLSYIVPIWEVTGTFAAFWVVTSDFAYPGLLIPVATLFPALIAVFVILFVLRNSSISFAELIVTKRWLNEKRLYQLYALSTVLIGLAVLVVISGIVSGVGVDLSNFSFSLGTWLTNPGSLLYVVGVLLIGVGLAPIFYDVAMLRRLTVVFTTVGLLVEASALYLYSSSFLSGWFLVPAVLTFLVPVLYQVPIGAKIVTNKLVFAAVGTVIVFSLNYLVYPTAFNGALPVDAVTTTGPMVGAFEALSVAGIFIVGGLMTLYLFAVQRSISSGGSAAVGTPPVVATVESVAPVETPASAGGAPGAAVR